MRPLVTVRDQNRPANQQALCEAGLLKFTNLVFCEADHGLRVPQ